MDNLKIEGNKVKTFDSKFTLGGLSKNPFGWRFIPYTTAHMSSRKNHPTMEAAIPAWVKSVAKRYKKNGSLWGV